LPVTILAQNQVWRSFKVAPPQIGSFWRRNATVSSAEGFYDHADEHFGWAETAKTEREVKLLLIEPRGVLNTGHEGGERTAENDVWI
jgi:hypothetical protein